MSKRRPVASPTAPPQGDAAGTDPLLMLHRFKSQHARGQPIDADVLDWLAARIADYLSSHGVRAGSSGPLVPGARSKLTRLTLDEALGLAGTPSARSTFTRRMLATRDKLYRLRALEAIALGYTGAELSRVVLESAEAWLVANGYPLRTPNTLANALVEWRRDPHFAQLVADVRARLDGSHPQAQLLGPWDGPIMQGFGRPSKATRSRKRAR